MNNLIYYIILLLGNLSSFTNVSERNRLKQEAFVAYQQKNNKNAVILYQKLADATYIVSPDIRMNLAHAYFSINDTLNAKIQYQRLLSVHNDEFASTALSQLGVIIAKNGDSTRAMSLFKEAIHKNANNEIARYNYEYLRKKLPSNKQPPPPKNQQQKQQTKPQDESKTTNISQQTEEKKETLKNIPPENVSKEKALQILEAMKNNEVQFGQKQKNINPKNKNHKDW